jgi:hypothetical protein
MEFEHNSANLSGQQGQVTEADEHSDGLVGNSGVPQLPEQQ